MSQSKASGEGSFVCLKILHFVQNDPMGGRATIYSNWMNLQYLPSEYDLIINY